MRTKKLTLFEHQTLEIDDADFKQYHFDALVRFNDAHGQRYCKIGFRKVTFTAHVGVIQLGDLVIEVLPKADNLGDEAAVAKWQRALLIMLKLSGRIRLNVTDKAGQSVNNYQLLDLFLYHFLGLTQELAEHGLVKKYRLQSGNTNVLKGKLLVNKQLTVNLVHRERFFTEHQVYDQDHGLNRVLKKALRIIQRATHNHALKSHAAELLGYFDWVSDHGPIPADPDRINYNRKTEPYRDAITLAYLIIRQEMPSFRAGETQVLALLLNMNQLFEAFVFRLLKREESRFTACQLQVNKQVRIPFWQEQHIKADIILSFFGEDGESNKIVIDTKWKRLWEERPADDDLKQMFVYNFQYGATHSVLLYPFTSLVGTGRHDYHESLHFAAFAHGCEVYFARLFDKEGMLIQSWAHGFLHKLLRL